MREGIEGDLRRVHLRIRHGLGVEQTDRLRSEFLDSRCPGAGHGLVGRDVDAFDADGIVDGLQRHHHLNGRTVRIRDDVGGQPVRDAMAVDLRHDKRNSVVHAELRGVVDHHRPGVRGPGRMVGRDGTAGRKQRDLRVGEVEIIEDLHRARLAPDLEALAGRTLAGQEAHVVDRESAFVEDFPHGFAHRACGAGDRNVQLLHGIVT